MIFAPVRLSTKGLAFIDTDGTSSYPYVLPEYLYLTDGGVFDNLGKIVFSRKRAILLRWTPATETVFGRGV
ncbi:hypothetical protein [Sinobaca sp. H24]|uniref:hypothetical protein n=1 Tax=Sinobaca sp. H24 TaxID=2923376 RepID=UPI002079990B|nr:hypothetical protein [Sinobaca sp. H24]